MKNISRKMLVFLLVSIFMMSSFAFAADGEDAVENVAKKVVSERELRKTGSDIGELNATTANLTIRKIWREFLGPNYDGTYPVRVAVFDLEVLEDGNLDNDVPIHSFILEPNADPNMNYKKTLALQKNKSYVVKELLPFGNYVYYFKPNQVGRYPDYDGGCIVNLDGDTELIIENNIGETIENFFISADENYEVWIDAVGQQQPWLISTMVDIPYNYNQVNKYEYKPGFQGDETIAIAVRNKYAVTTSGLKVMYTEYGNGQTFGTYGVTNTEDWWVYAIDFSDLVHGSNTPPLDSAGRYWYEKDYVRGNGWVKASYVTDSSALYNYDHFRFYWNDCWPEYNHDDWIFSSDWHMGAPTSDAYVYFRKEAPSPVKKGIWEIVKEWQDENGAIIDPADVNQEIILHIKDSDGNVVKTVTIPAGDSSVTISLPEGSGYTIEEDTPDGYDTSYLIHGNEFDTFSVVEVFTHIPKIKVINRRQQPESHIEEPSEPNSEEISPTETKTVTNAYDVPDEELPQTGGIPLSVYLVFGCVVLGVGIAFKKRK